MRICDMNHEASLDLLKRTRLGRLACAHEGQPYITPIFFAYEDGNLYCFATFGQRISWMRTNPLVCLAVDEVTSAQVWRSVVVMGTYEELPNTPQYEFERARAYELLQRRPVWWEPGCAKTTLEGKTRPMESVHFRILIEKISGRQALPDPDFSSELVPESASTHRLWRMFRIKSKSRVESSECAAT